MRLCMTCNKKGKRERATWFPTALKGNPNLLSGDDIDVVMGLCDNCFWTYAAANMVEVDVASEFRAKGKAVRPLTEFKPRRLSV